MDGKVTVYEEGIFVGYRYYDKYGVPVLFPFGHGLSYSDFGYKNLKIGGRGGKIEINFEIENKSALGGKEVAQIYVRNVCSTISRPEKELKAFKKVFIAAGKTEKVSVNIDISDLAYWSVVSEKWEVEDGVYEIIVAASATDIRLTGKITVKDGVFYATNRIQ